MKRGYNGELLANARSLRKAMTPWERKLWFLFLRTYPVKVYRQRIIGNYIVDFYCPSAKLVIELDGSQHFDRERAPDEARRTARLQEYGCTVLRFPNIDIDRAFRAVCETIDREIRTLTQQSNRQEAAFMNYEKLDAIVASYRDELIANIQKWVSVPSVKGEPAGENAPFGAEVRRMLDMALEDGRRFGFEVRDIDGYAGDISWGRGEKTMGMLAHLDIVPLGDGWTHDPLGGEIDGGRLYGRGATDDKGPALCALYAMRAVKEAGIPLRDGLRLILGCDEETGMSDMLYYASKVRMPDYGFSPDAEFPVINIEKGSIHMRLSAVTGGEAGADMPVYSLYAGERPNVVPAEAKAVVGLGALNLAELGAKLADIEKAHDRFRLSAAPAGEGKAEITATGVNAHAAMPERGVNAAGMLLIALKELGAGRNGGSREAIATLADAVGMDHTGEKLGIACADELSGALTCNLGILRYDGNEISALLDIRYPLCGDEAQILGGAARTVGPALGVTCAGSHTPLHVPAESDIVQGLLKAYADVTGLEPYTIAIGGGTYSRMMPNTVAFGVCFPGDMDVCHIADEYIDLEKLMLGVKIFAHAIVELAGQG